MSENVKLQVFLKAVDQATRPFKHIGTASKALSGEIRGTQKTLRELNAQAGKIDGFRKASAQLAVTGQSLEKAKAEAEALATQFRNTQKPTLAQGRAMESAKRAAESLQAKYNSLSQSVARQKDELGKAGINTRNLAAGEQRLKTSISETTAQLARQREALARVSAQQEKLNAVKARYQKGRAFAGSAAGAAAVGMATTGIVAGSALMRPGYEFAQKNSELQAVLGVEKQSAEMQALRNQARQLGDNTAASAGDAAAAQIIIAKAGGNAAAIQAATPVTLNMSLANRQTMEENAQLLLGTKNAFQLSNDKVAHIGDVLSATMNKSAADFQGLSDAMTYLAPVARAAGVSLEEAAAMTGVLHDNNITGSMAGTGSSAVVTRLQTPTGEAFNALKELGIQTADSKGNMRPVFTILKEISASFASHKLGNAQQGEYLKTIFGEEALKSANALLQGATSGKLDKLAAALKASDGKTAELVGIMQDNLGGDFKEFQSAYEAVGTDLFDQQESSLRKLVQTATRYVLRLDNWIKNNKALAGTLTMIAGVAAAVIGVVGAIGLVAWPVITGINAIIAVAGSLGTIFTVAGSAIATAIGALTWPIVAVVAAIVAGAFLIRKYWQPISAFFGGVMDGLRAAFGPVGELFAPFKPVFTWLGEKLQAVWQWFKDLIEPVQSSKETLDNCRSAGERFGKGLADALLLPLKAFNKLREGITWVLEKLGVVNKESDALDAKAEKANAVASRAGGMSGAAAANVPAGMFGQAPAYQAYQPVSAAGGRSYIDQSRNHYNISVAGGAGAGGADYARQMREELDRIEREKRARSRASMGHDG
ncbi:Phage protein [Cronobacter condimenti 1330]|uniref:Phage protein n=1 Tax=Cronobacter condimenti 1330 TaxID=1073999 RepID=K8ACI5_9ENTR|nr:phage tail tape measure protein [Cronobacter condimenti]ALB64024.1 phage tail protein [Cronobacter condimenti 1330]CCJ71977.1 Phage protein [Cronobacter condimenti 1330]